MKIITHQQGGTFVPPFAVYQSQYIAPQQTSTEKTNSDNKKSSKFDINDIYEKLGDLEALPVDSRYVQSKLNQLIQNLENPGLLDTDSIASEYMQILNILNDLKYQKEEYKEARKSAIDKGSLNEVAIDSSGRIMTYSKENGYQWTSLNEYNPKQHIPVTNAQLLDLRANKDLGLAFDTESLYVVADGVSMNSITSKIDDIIKNLGNTEISASGYTNRQAKDILKGIEIFKNLNTSESISSLYKQKIITKDQAQQIQVAFNYIYNSLTTKEQALLQYKSGEFGLEGILSMLIASKQSIKYDFDVDDESSSSTSSNGGDKQDFLLKVQNAIGGSYQKLNMDIGNGIKLESFGRYWSSVEKPSGEIVGVNNIQELLTESQMQKLIKDPKKIKFGDQLVDAQQLKNILYNNSGFFRVNLPVKEDGSAYVELLENYEKAEKYIEQNGNSPEVIAEAYEKFEIPQLLNPDGARDITKFAPFIVFEGITTSANGIEESEFLVDKGEIDDVTTTLLEEYTDLEVDQYSILNPVDWLSAYDKLYKATVFIPIDNNRSTLVQGAKAVSEDQKYLQFEQRKNLGITQDELLWK